MKRSVLFLLGVAAAMLLSCNPVKPVDPHAFNIGSGMFVVGIWGTVLVYVSQFIMHRFAVGADSYAGSRLQFTVERGHNFNAALDEQVEEWKAKVTESTVTRNRDGTDNYEVIVRRKDELTYTEFKKFVDSREDVVSASTNPLHGGGSRA